MGDTDLSAEIRRDYKDDGLGWGVLRYTAIIEGNQPVEQGKTCVILVNEDLCL